MKYLISLSLDWVYKYVDFIVHHFVIIINIIITTIIIIINIMNEQKERPILLLKVYVHPRSLISSVSEPWSSLSAIGTV